MRGFTLKCTKSNTTIRAHEHPRNATWRHRLSHTRAHMWVVVARWFGRVMAPWCVHTHAHAQGTPPCHKMHTWEREPTLGAFTIAMVGVSITCGKRGACLGQGRERVGATLFMLLPHMCNCCVAPPPLFGALTPCMHDPYKCDARGGAHLLATCSRERVHYALTFVFAHAHSQGRGWWPRGGVRLHALTEPRHKHVRAWRHRSREGVW